MKKKIIILFLATVIYTILFTGCSPSYRSKQLELRDQGVAFLDEGDYESAIKTFNDALAMSYGSVTESEIDICYYKAAALYENGQSEDAVGLYSALINFDDSNYKAYFLRGCAYINEAELTPALADYDRAVELNKNDYRLYIEIYENLAAVGFADNGRAYLTKALELNAKSAEELTYAGQIYYLLNEYSQAKEYLEKADDAGNTEAKIYLAKVYEENGDDIMAAELLREYASSENVTSEALGELGDLEASAGNYSKALDYYNAGLNLEEPENKQQLLKGKTVALENLRRFSEAKETLTQYVDEFPEDSDAKRELIFLSTR